MVCLLHEVPVHWLLHTLTYCNYSNHYNQFNCVVVTPLTGSLSVCMQVTNNLSSTFFNHKLSPRPLFYQFSNFLLSDDQIWPNVFTHEFPSPCCKFICTPRMRFGIYTKICNINVCSLGYTPRFVTLMYALWDIHQDL